MKLSAAIALVVLSLFAPPARFLVYLRLALITALVLVATGCAPAPAPLIKPREVEVTTYVREPIPAELTQDRNFAEQTPQCTRDGKPVLCNGQQSIELNDCRAVVDQHNADKAALRQLNTNTPPTKREANPAAGTPAAGHGQERRR